MSISYQEFLETKKISIPPQGVEIDLSELNSSLFPFQKVLVQWALRKGRVALFADTGLGKSRMQVEWAWHTRQRTLLLAPLSVARQTVQEAAKISVNAHYTRSGDDLVDGINITNYEMLSHFDPKDFGAVVLDECFDPDTLIDTPNGAIPIKNIHVGDYIFNAIGIDQVSDVHRREVQYAVRITVNGKSIISSPNHPYFTQRGWVGAQDIQPGDSFIHTPKAVRILRDGISTENKTGGETQKVLQQILLSEMANETTRTFSKSTYAGDSSETRQEQECMACIRGSQSRSRKGEGSIAQSYEQPRVQSKVLPKIERDEAQTFRAWGKWDGINTPATDTTGCTWRRMDSGICFVTGQTDSWLSNELQDRHRQYQTQNRYRSGWTLTPEPQETRPEKGYETDFSRVDSLEVLQLGHPDLERLRDADGHIYLYDIGATQHPSFSVNGLLVHNSSILKSLDGKTRSKLIEMFVQTPYRLCCSATPAPNDIAEIANHAEFLGIMSRAEMLAMFFVHDNDNGSGSGWRLKGHAHEAFYRWLASWSMSVKKPSDLGFDDTGYILPELKTQKVITHSDYVPEGQLFFAGLKGIGDRSKARRGTIEERVHEAVKLVSGNDEQWLVWCGMNDESTALARAIDGSVEVVGSDTPDKKIASIEAFQDGKIRVLITKPKIAGSGINLQNCHNMIFVGLGDSFESYYQCIRRCWRFGQQHHVNVYIVLSEIEEEIYANVLRKEEEAKFMSEQLIQNVQVFEREELAPRMEQVGDYSEQTITNDHYTLMLGDSCERMAEIPDDHIDLSVFSPPFQSLYTYSPTERDLGNSRSADEFYTHFNYIIDELLRTTKPGRNCCVHVQQIAASLVHDGFIGLKDFRGEIITAFVGRGWIYHGEVAIDKNPQAQAIRTKAKGLLFTQFHKDSTWSRPGLADYIIIFRKPGENVVPVHPDINNEEWIKFAHPIWYDIRESDTLNVAEGRDEKDERHVCPLQLGTIERCVRLWSNPGETVFSPFCGIGSEGYEAIRNNRKFIGIELKPSYFQAAKKNLDRITKQKTQATLWDEVAG